MARREKGIAAGVFEPLGLVLRPAIAALSMSGSSFIVAVNALMLKQMDLPTPAEPSTPATRPVVEPSPGRSAMRRSKAAG